MSSFLEYLDPSMPTPSAFNITGGYESGDDYSPKKSEYDITLTPVQKNSSLFRTPTYRKESPFYYDSYSHKGIRSDPVPSSRSEIPATSENPKLNTTKNRSVGTYAQRPDLSYEHSEYTNAVQSFSRTSSHNCRRQQQSRDVFERLTDHRYFTGIHRERFDENGNGRGLAGREDVYIYDGSTESVSRIHDVYSTVLHRPYKKVMTRGILGIQKFGVQMATPKLMWIYRNGDKYHDGVAFYVRPFIKSMETLYFEMGKELQLIAGPIRRIYDQNLQLVRNLEDIVDGAKYLCTSGEPPAPTNRLDKFMSEWVIQKVGH